MKDISLTYFPSETQLAFHNDSSTIKGIAGPPGSGKSASMLLEAVFRTFRQPPSEDGVRYHRLCIVRKSHGDLKRTTMKTIRDWIEPKFGRVSLSPPLEGVFWFPMNDGTKACLEIVLLSTDDMQAALDSLASLEISSAWIHEATEQEEAILDRLLERVGRFPSAARGATCAEPGVVLDFNLPGKEHWLYRRMMTGPDKVTYMIPDGQGGERPYEVTRKFFMQPPAVFCDNIDAVENDRATPIFRINPDADNLRWLEPGYYARQLQERPTWEQWVKIKSRLLMIWAATSKGKLVHEREFSRAAHVAREPIRPVPNTLTVCGVDTSGMHPAAIFMQVMGGSAFVTDEVYGDNISFEQFISDMLLPLIASRYAGCQIVAPCDPANARWGQTGINPVQLLNANGIPAVLASTNSFPIRRQAVSSLLMRRNGLLISPECVNLIDGFEASYVYKKLPGNTSGQPVYSDQVDKTESASHFMDALQYAALFLTRKNETLPVPEHIKNMYKQRQIV